MSEEEKGNIQDFSGITIICSMCHGSFHETTELYDPETILHGDYFKLVEKYGPRGFNWTDFPHTHETTGDNVFCPQCGNAYSADHVKKWVMRSIQIREEYAAFIEVANEQANGECVRVAAEALPDSDDQDCDHADNGVFFEAQRNNQDGVFISEFESKVIEMTLAGKTQVEIAEALQTTVYNVRKVQHGKSK